MVQWSIRCANVRLTDVLTFIIRQELLRGVDSFPLLIEHGVSRLLENLDTCLWNEAVPSLCLLNRNKPTIIAPHEQRGHRQSV